MLKYRIKNMEPFKDGNIMNGRFLKAGEVLVVDEVDAVKIKNSGGVIEILETLVPNPLKAVKSPEIEDLIAEQESNKEEDEKSREGEAKQAREVTFRQEAVEQRETKNPRPEGNPKRSPGRQKKNEA